MSDFWGFMFPYLFGIVEVLVEYYFFYRFLSKRVSLIYLIFFGVAGYIVIMLCSAGDMVKFASYVALFVMSGIAIGKIRIIPAFMYAIVMLVIMNMCYGIFNSVSCILAPHIFTGNSRIIGLLFMYGSSILSVMVAVFCYVLLEKYLLKNENDSGQYIFMILAPILLILYISEYISQRIYGNTVTINDNGALLTQANPYQILLIQILGIASLFCILYAYQKIVESFQVGRQVSLLEQETHLLNQYVEEARIRYGRTQSFRHDVKNHITVLKELIEKNENNAALKYVLDMEVLSTELSFPVNANNPILNVLLENKLGLAIGKGIDVESTLYLPDPLAIADIDLCIVVANALDNAITACDNVGHDAQKFIHIAGKIQGSFLVIEIKNSCLGAKEVNIGIGLSNIKAVAEKYGGAMSIKSEGNIFTLSVLFIIPQQSDDISRQVH